VDERALAHARAVVRIAGELLVELAVEGGVVVERGIVLGGEGGCAARLGSGGVAGGIVATRGVVSGGEVSGGIVSGGIVVA
jgi:hypothetical protein